MSFDFIGEKMKTALSEKGEALYSIGNTRINDFIGKRITIKFNGDINCIHCQRSIKKTYSQGYCFPCSQKLAECDLCVVKPHLCHYEKGTCRDEKWGEKFCMQEHVLYLSVTSELKVGLTRRENVPHRWIDQGAEKAIELMSFSSRYLAGLHEHFLTQHYADKTNWRKMLSAPSPLDIDLLQEKEKALILLEPFMEEKSEIFGEDSIYDSSDDICSIEYPVQQYPKTLKSIDFLKDDVFSALLLGVKGQYLLFEHHVLNMRKYTGFNFSFGGPV